MTVWRWRVSGVPGKLLQAAATAFLPPVTKQAGSWQQYKAGVEGHPGTMAVEAPNNDIPSSPLLVSSDSRSSDAPPYWVPAKYWQPGLIQLVAADDTGRSVFAGGVRIYSDNQLPVPSIDPTRGTHRVGGGVVTPVYQQPFGRRPTKRRVSRRHA